MLTQAFVFAIFMLTLGPIKTIPAFYLLSDGAPAADRRRLAVRAVIAATLVCLFVALFMERTMRSWQISLDALRIAGGILLLQASVRAVGNAGAQRGPRPAALTGDALLARAVSPLAIPTIVTPWGVVAILLFIGTANGDHAQLAMVIGTMMGVMLLNLLGMLAAGPIMRTLGFGLMQTVGWVFAVLQAALAIQAVIGAFVHLGLIARLPPAS